MMLEELHRHLSDSDPNCLFTLHFFEDFLVSPFIQEEPVSVQELLLRLLCPRISFGQPGFISVEVLRGASDRSIAELALCSYSAFLLLLG